MLLWITLNPYRFLVLIFYPKRLLNVFVCIPNHALLCGWKAPQPDSAGQWSPFYLQISPPCGSFIRQSPPTGICPEKWGPITCCSPDRVISAWLLDSFNGKQSANCSVVQIHSMISHLNQFCELQFNGNSRFCKVHVILTMGMVRLSHLWRRRALHCMYSSCWCADFVSRETNGRCQLEAAGESGCAFPDNSPHYRLYLEESVQLWSCLHTRPSTR